MSDALALAKHRLTLGLDRERLDVRPLNADQWAVRAGDNDRWRTPNQISCLTVIGPRAYRIPKRN